MVPFTTPQFTGARLRIDRSGGFELMLRNPAGGKGIYLLELSVAHRFSAISLHDRILHAELQKQVRLSPRTVRLCARRVAVSGAAGHQARMAAKASATRERHQIARMREHLLRSLLPSGSRAHEAPTAASRGANSGAEEERLAAAAARSGMPARRLMQALQEIAEHAVAIGLPAAGIASDHEETLRALAALAEALGKWRNDGAGWSAEIAVKVAQLAEETARVATEELACQQRRLADGRELLRQWQEDRAGLIEFLETCDWLLDGWPELCVLWQSVPTADRALQAAALIHIGKLLPPAPEIDGEPCRGDAAFDAFTRAARASTDWRDELRLAEILERQEALRAELAA